MTPATLVRNTVALVVPSVLPAYYKYAYCPKGFRGSAYQRTSVTLPPPPAPKPAEVASLVVRSSRRQVDPPPTSLSFGEGLPPLVSGRRNHLPPFRGEVGGTTPTDLHQTPRPRGLVADASSQ